VEGGNVPVTVKFHQALHGIYIPHSEKEHHLLPVEFPSHYYKNELASSQASSSGPSHLSELLARGEIYEIPVGSQGFANEYDPSHLPKAFPVLHPFGVGGLNDPRRYVRLSAEDHLKYLCEQSHGLFARHEVFIFVAFNTLQRRNVCLGSKLITSKMKLPEICSALESLDYESIAESIGASGEKASNIIDSDPTLRKLMSMTSIANGICQGTSQYVKARRREARSVFIRRGMPAFFFTLNPDDSRHLLFYVMCRDITSQGSPYSRVRVPILDDSGLYRRFRCKMAGENPIIQAQFFDIIFRAVMDILFGFGRDSRLGILGKVATHYSMIEAQGKGTLHAHCLVWLSDGKRLISIVFKRM